MYTYSIVLVFVLLCLIELWIRQLRKAYKGIDQLPGPFLLPIVGNTFSLGRDLTVVFRNVHKMHDIYGDVYRIWPLYTKPTVLVSDADAIGNLICSMKYIDKSREYKFLEPWLHTGLLTSTGTKWHRRRKMITPAFHFQVLDDFTEIFAKEADTLVEKLMEVEGQPSVDIYPLINKFALDTICKTAMGVDINTQSGDNMKYMRAVKTMQSIAGIREFDLIEHFDSSFRFTRDYYLMKKVLKILHSFTHKVISMRRDSLLRSNSEEFINKLTSGKPKIAFLDLLITKTEDGLPLTDEDIQEEVDTFMFEGFDTVTSALAFTMYELAKCPEIQDKILEEIKYIFGEDLDGSYTTNNINQLKYLGQVVKEGLRLYPSVPIFYREIQEDFHSGKYTFPKKTTIAVNAFSLHRQSKHFENPNEFIPERFDNDLTGKHPYCYLPFSGGPRNCIGQKFAMNEMKTALSKIIGKYKLYPAEPTHNLELYVDTILKSRNGIRLKLIKRK